MAGTTHLLMETTLPKWLRLESLIRILLLKHGVNNKLIYRERLVLHYSPGQGNHSGRLEPAEILYPRSVFEVRCQ
jgi:hypothetical protein